ncbi:MAG: GNAT family N-acetyltransferase [Acutalibacteraceae bacterium]
MKHTGTQTIVTPRLTLRRFNSGDAEEMFKNWTNDSRVTKYVTWQPHGNIENTKALLKMWIDSYKDENYYNWAIEYDGRVIGNITAVDMNDKL